MNIHLRWATREDAELIADVSRQTFYDTFAADNTEEDMATFMDKQFIKSSLMQEVEQPENTFLLAYVGQTLAGYLKLREGKKVDGIPLSSSLEIARLYVVKEFIGKGVGKHLMQAAIDTAKQNQKSTIWLGVWEHNQRAIQFYTNWGFQKFGECDFLLGDDHQTDWMMKKTLGL